MAKNANTNTEANKIHDTTSKIDAIKQLIFGENIVEYNHEFENVKQDILQKKRELENLMDEVKIELLQHLDNISTDLNIRITDIENRIDDRADVLDDKKIDRKLLGDLIIKLGEKINE